MNTTWLVPSDGDKVTLTRGSTSTEILESHISFPLTLQGIFLLNRSQVLRFPSPLLRRVSLPGDRVATQIPGQGIPFLQEIKGLDFKTCINSWEQGEGGQKQEEEKKRRVSSG